MSCVTGAEQAMFSHAESKAVQGQGMSCRFVACCMLIRSPSVAVCQSKRGVGLTDRASNQAMVVDVAVGKRVLSEKKGRRFCSARPSTEAGSATRPNGGGILS